MTTDSASGQPARRPGPAVEAIAVLVVADQRSFCEALAARLEQEPDLRVVATATTVDEARRIMRGRRIDVAVVDVDGGDVLGRLDRPLTPPGVPTALVGMAAAHDVAVLAAAVRAGFRGWVPKDDGVQTLLSTLRTVHQFGTCIPPQLLTGLLLHLMNEGDERRAAALPFAALTRRELEVLRAMAVGASRPEIAEKLSISPNTVRTHAQSILNKLGVHTTLAAVRLARTAGLA